MCTYTTINGNESFTSALMIVCVVRFTLVYVYSDMHLYIF